MIVGSGPAGVSAAIALVKGGHHVTILDVGDELDKDREAIVSRMSGQRVDEWNLRDREAISGSRSSTKDAVHSKQSYGSSYSFASGTYGKRVEWLAKRGFHHSHARGGLSNIWGAAMLPCRQQDIPDWPIDIRELEPHFRAVMDFVPCTSSDGSIDDILPSYGANGAPLRFSQQAQDLIAELGRSAQKLMASGIRYGKSRLAVRTEDDPGCHYCSMCLSGCPYGLVYSSAQTLRDLITSGKVTYLKGHLVESIQSENSEVIVFGKRLNSGDSFTLRATRIFLAAGVIPTAALILSSLGFYGRTLTLRDSQYYIYPLLKIRKTENVETEGMQTLSQIFLEIDDAAISPFGVHLQVYGYSTFLREELERTFLRLPLRSRMFRREFLGRLMVAQGYLHSCHSGRITLRLMKDSAGADYLECQAHRDWKTIVKILQVGWKLLAQFPRTKALPLLPAVKISTPGSSYHCGGSMPMKMNPSELQTDTMGRLHGCPRVHIVDASVLPSIPATTITFSLMANSHRIATLAQALDSE